MGNERSICGLCKDIWELLQLWFSLARADRDEKRGAVYSIRGAANSYPVYPETEIPKEPFFSWITF